MWPIEEFDYSYPVTLVLGEERQIVQEETSFLATISPVFKAMFYSGCGEAGEIKSTLVELPNCNAHAMKHILKALKEAMDRNISIDDVFTEYTPQSVLLTLYAFRIGSANIEKNKELQNCITLRELEKIAKLSARTGIATVLKQNHRKFVSKYFLQYRNTAAFKTKTIQELQSCFSRPIFKFWPFFNFEILEAVLIWLDYDMDERKVHFEKALALVNWKYITFKESKRACCLEIVQKNETLFDFFVGIYERKSNKYKMCSTTSQQPVLEGFALARKLLATSRI